MSELSAAKDGLSQQERRIPALFPENFRIDDKSSTELLRYMYDIAAEINFYNLKNEIDGDWQGFFYANANLLILLTSQQDYAENLTRFEYIESQLQFSDNDKDFFEQVKKLFDYLGETVYSVQQLKEKFSKIYIANNKIQSIADLVNRLDARFPDFKAVYQQYHREFGKQMPVVDTLENLDVQVTGTTDFFASGEESLREQITTSVKYLKQTFHELRRQYSHFLGTVKYYLQSYDMFKDRQPPHMAICLAFIYLYQYLQEEINGLPKKHLDLYYKEILNLKPLPAEPDSAYVIFEPDPLHDTVLLKKGEELLAEPKGQDPLTYQTDYSVQITQATVAELKTVYISRYIRDILSAEVDLLKLYQNEWNNITPAELLKARKTLSSWPALGEEQTGFGENQRTMTDATLASVIASPVLFLPEGDRHIKIRIYLNSSSAWKVESFITNYQQIKQSDFGQVSFDLFSNVFCIHYTTATGWQYVQRCSAVYAKSGTDHYIEIKINLPPAEPAPVNYDPQIHGGMDDIAFPAVRLELNNNSAVHGYSFLRNIVVDRVQIKAKVEGAKSFKLSNNFGAVNATTAFPPFGSPVLRGAVLIIKNSNVFNRYTKRFRIYLDWLGLPEMAGGFEAYYEGYEGDFKNDSFKIKIASVNNGRSAPEEEEQQKFNLFSVAYNSEGHEYLLNQTVLDHIYMQQLEFTNYPLMAVENDITGTTYDDGAIRLVLTDPPAAFGSELYAQTVTEVMLHNAHRFVRKRPIPNLPYIPMLKNLKADYTLETSEVMNMGSASGSENLSIHHIYPFGYKQVYPVGAGKPIHLFPDIQRNRNLYIGLKNVLPGQELSLLFYLEENNFIDTLKEEIIIEWSYLHKNNWLNVSTANLLFDSANNLINTGVVKLRVPTELSLDNTVLPPGLFWLRLSVEGFTEVYSKIIAVATNAVMVSRVMDSDSSENVKLLPKNVIKSFKGQVWGVKSIIQPFYSFKGKAAESEQDYYVRVSERLRHKNRPMMIRHIEQFVLQAFPEILMAKCVTRNDADIEQLSGPGATIRVILIPSQNNNGVYATEQPMVNMATLFKVHKLLSDALPKFINAKVSNPVYERVKVVAKITFTDHDQVNQQFYLNNLFEDIRKFFCPWLSQTVIDIEIGSKVFVTDVLSFIKGLPYVSNVSGFSLVHFYTVKHFDTAATLHKINDLAVSEGAYLQGSVPEAILIPSENHEITVSNNADYDMPRPVGVGDLSIGDEFLVVNKQEMQRPALTDTLSPADDDGEEFFNLTISEI